MKPENGEAIHRSLCFYQEPPDGNSPSYIAETSNTPGQRNYDHRRVTVGIGDIRGREESFSLQTHSFTALPCAFSGICVDFRNDTEILNRYTPYIKTLILDNVPGAEKIMVFDYVIRKASTQKTPSRQVRKIHIDQSPNGALGRARRHLDSHTVKLIESGEKRFLIINAWKPINGNVTDHPLTFADYRSLRQSELVPVKQIYPDYIGETYAVRRGDQQKFWYWSNMNVNDVLLLQCFDSAEKHDIEEGGVTYAQCAHGSFELNEGSEINERESIEVRCLVLY